MIPIIDRNNPIVEVQGINVSINPTIPKTKPAIPNALPAFEF
jgi:hypothetical protein